MYDAQAQTLFEEVEVAISMKKSVSRFETESRDDAIHRLAYRVPKRAQRPVISSGGHGESHSTGIEDFKVQKVAVDSPEDCIVPDALQDLAKDEVGEAKALPVQFAVKPQRFGIPDPAKIVNPNGDIYDYHPARYDCTRPSRDSWRSPSHCTFPRRRRIAVCA